MSSPALRPSRVFLITVAVGAVLGVVGGMAFLWAPPRRAWEILTAAFLWGLILAAGTTIGRFFSERVRRGNWRHGIWLAFVQSFPLTTIFLVAASAVGGLALLPGAAPFCYAATLAVALCTGLLGVLTSPFIR